MNKKNLIIAITILTLINQAAAVSIGAGPSTLDFRNLVRGGYDEKSITVSTSGSDDLACEMTFDGDIKDWITSDSDMTFNLPAKSRKDILISIQPPLVVENRKYSGSVYIKAGPISESERGTGMAVGAGVRIKISVEVIGEERVSYFIESLSIQDAEIGYTAKTAIKLRNTGNIKANPLFIINVQDQTGKTALKTEYNKTTTTPPRIEEIIFELPTENLNEGKYTAEINTYAGQTLNSQINVSFRILPKGTLSVSGKLEELTTSNPTPSVGEVVRINGKFKNTGEIRFPAKLKAEAYLDNKLVEVLPDSEELNTEPGQTIELQTYFKPQQAGNYIIRANAVYMGSKTNIQATVITVQGGGIPMILIYAAIIVALILSIIYLQRKKRKTTL